jgi:signal transduction histidine kinase
VFKSIFERLFWTNALILLLVFISISITLTLFVTTYAMEKQYDLVTKASDSIEYMTISLQIESNNAQSTTLYKHTLDSWAEFANADITIINSYGEVFASTTTVMSIPEESAKSVLNGRVIKERGTFGGQYPKKVFTVGLPISYKGNIIGGMFFNTMMPDLNKTVLEVLYIFLLSSVMTIIVAFIFLYFQSRRISKPIKQINRAAMNIAAGKFDNRVDIASGDEIGQLASSFNFMADSLERLETMRDNFISDVSHELRTPMTSISGFVQGILDRTIPPEEEEKYLQIVLDESVRLTKLVNDMLDVSKMENSEYKLDISEFDITELVRLCIIQLEQRIDSKNLELDVDFEKDNISVLADKDAIRRVIINLLDNAIKFSYENTKIQIKVWTQSKNAFISVGNFGIGIENKNLRYVFDRFYKTDKSRGNDKKGAGLGLALVKNIISCHNQKIWVESIDTKEGSAVKYTTFTFTLEKA